MRITRHTILILIVASLSVRGGDSKACTDLLSYPLSAGTITKADTVEGNSSAEGAVPAYCRVAATLKPSADSDIKMELWLPLRDWNGKLEANGNGGWTGSI